MKTLFWIIVIACALFCFPEIVAGIVVLVAVLFVAALVALLTKDQRETKAEREREESKRREREAAELERSEEQSEIAQKWAKIHKEKQEKEARAAEEEHRAQAEQIAKYNRLAKEAAAAGDLEDAECWRRLAVAELDKYTNRSI